MKKKTKVLYMLAAIALLVLIYIASLGLGVVITNWFGINLETGCPIDAVTLKNETTEKKCKTGMYECSVSNPFNLYIVCPMYGTAICIVVVIAGIIYCVKRCASSKPPDYYSDTYSQVIDWRDN
jgi:hypothetical protein